jgi:hypothetical protein
MKQRALFRSQLTKAWKECIDQDYQRRRINSERSLQASLWSRLNSKLSVNRQIFIEPRIYFKESAKAYIPDFVICNSRQVISIIEIKYQPRVKPDYVKDIATLAEIAKRRGKVELRNERHLGGVPKTFDMAEQVLFVWAGVHLAIKPANKASFADGIELLRDCYFELHAATEIDQPPHVYSKCSWKK